MQQEHYHWGHWIEPWYLVYATMGLIVAGSLPILIPLIVDRSGNPGLVGLVVAAVSLGGLSTPLWGALADHYRAHTTLLAGGLLIAGLALVAFAFSTNLALWFVLAMIQGLGTASTATVANFFIRGISPAG